MPRERAIALLRGARRAVQGRDPARASTRRRSRSTSRAISSTSAAGRTSPPPAQLKAFKLLSSLRRLLARGREEPDAAADLRDRLAHPGGARQAPLAARGGEEARSPQARARARPVRLLRHRARARRSGCPAGMVLVRELEKFARESLDARGYQEISTPLLVNKKLWEQSGHWDLYQDNMFKFDVEDEVFSLKPMNCPESTYVYKRALRSYRDLPIRYSEMGRCHRNERSGTLSGLVRVRQFTQDDAHHLLPARAGPGRDHGSPRAGARVVRAPSTCRPRTGWPRARPTSSGPSSSGTGGGRAPPGAAGERSRLRSGQGRRRLLRAQDRHRRGGRAGAAVAARHHPGRPHDAARAHAVRVHRHGRPGQAAGGDPPRDLRLLRALRGDPHRALRGRVPDLARPGAGARPADQREARRVRAAGLRAPARRRASAPSSTIATRSWATASATPRCARSRTCWSWESARPRTARPACVAARARTWARCRWSASWPSSRAEIGSRSATLTVGHAG